MNIYPEMAFPSAPAERPYVFINMVTTIDGKIITGERDEPVQDLGSKLDHQTMKVIEDAADAIMMGAATIRATPRMRLAEHLIRYCVSESGRVDPRHSFFNGYENWIIRSENTEDLHLQVSELKVGKTEIDWLGVMRIMRQEHGVERLLCEGGAELNACLFALDLVDEIFWTVAPKIKLGREVPTIAGGTPLHRTEVMNFDLISCQPIEGEIFLRYRRHRPVA